MSQLATLEYAPKELIGVMSALDDSQMDTITSCAPWTVRQLASHAVNNQLLWAGIVTGEDIVAAEVTMGAVAYDGDLTLSPTTRRAGLWPRTPKVCWRGFMRPRWASCPVRS